MRQPDFQKRTATVFRMLAATLFISAILAGTAVRSEAQVPKAETQLPKDKLRPDFTPDVRLGFFTNGSSPTLGGGIQVDLGNFIAFNPAVEIIIVTNGGDNLFFSSDMEYYFGRTGFNLYTGAGLGILTSISKNGTGASVGLNLLTGFDYLMTGLIPYVQVKVFISNATTLQVAAGIRF